MNLERAMNYIPLENRGKIRLINIVVKLVNEYDRLWEQLLLLEDSLERTYLKNRTFKIEKKIKTAKKNVGWAKATATNPSMNSDMTKAEKFELRKSEFDFKTEVAWLQRASGKRSSSSTTTFQINTVTTN